MGGVSHKWRCVHTRRLGVYSKGGPSVLGVAYMLEGGVFFLEDVAFILGVCGVNIRGGPSKVRGRALQSKGAGRPK